MKKYITIDFDSGSTIDDAVGVLQSLQNAGFLAKGTFNDVTLYSDEVTTDSAYILITGKNKADFEKLLGETN